MVLLYCAALIVVGVMDGVGMHCVDVCVTCRFAGAHPPVADVNSTCKHHTHRLL